MKRSRQDAAKSESASNLFAEFGLSEPSQNVAEPTSDALADSLDSPAPSNESSASDSANDDATSSKTPKKSSKSTKSESTNKKTRAKSAKTKKSEPTLTLEPKIDASSTLFSVASLSETPQKAPSSSSVETGNSNEKIPESTQSPQKLPVETGNSNEKIPESTQSPQKLPVETGNSNEKIPESTQSSQKLPVETGNSNEKIPESTQSPQKLSVETDKSNVKTDESTLSSPKVPVETGNLNEKTNESTLSSPKVPFETDNSNEKTDEKTPESTQSVSKIPNKTSVATSPKSAFSLEKTELSSNSIPTFSASSSAPSAYQVVARRYRPQAFDELIGQEMIARALSNAIETNRVGHAYLFTGARGVGKTSCARIFAKALNCAEGPTTRPCLHCDSCVSISTGDDVDVLEIDGASNRGVDEIRQLRQNATVAPTRSHYKIYIIDEVHMLTREAFNALLKTLEEPPARVKFIFCTTEPNKIPVTILSRCQRFDFSGIAARSISSRLAQIAAKEGAQAEEGVFEILARRANGSMRDAQSLLEQLLSFAPTYISQADARGMLGSVDDKKIFDLLDATVAADPARVFTLLGDAAAQGVDFGVLVEQTLGVYRDLMVVASGCDANELTGSPIVRFPELKKIADSFGIRRILASLQILDQTAQRLRFTTQTRILTELAFARLCLLDSFQALESLIAQIRQGSLGSAEIRPDASSEKKNLTFR